MQRFPDSGGSAFAPHVVSGDIVRIVRRAEAGDFDPAGFFALGFKFHVDLEARLGEGEEVRTETDHGLGAEDLAEEELQSAFEIG